MKAYPKKIKIFDILDIVEKKFGKDNVIFLAKENKKWKPYTLREYKYFATNLAKGLIKLGYQPGEKIITVSNNRPEWNFLDMGIAMAGLVHVPIYSTLTVEDFEYIFKHSDGKMLVVSDRFLYKKLAPIAQKNENIRHIYTFDQIEGAKNWKDLMQLGLESNNTEELEKRKEKIQPDDLFTMIYTSGTTGDPKGVMLSHWNFTYQIQRLDEIMSDITHNDRSLSFLPLCHSFERVVNYVMQYKGIKIYYAEGFHKLADNLKEVRPHVFASVPRVLERIYDKIVSLAKQLPPMKQKIFFYALKLAEQFDFNKGLLYKAQLGMVDGLVFSQWRKAFGGNVKFIVSGGAALNPRLNRIFWAAKIQIREGYGLSETSPVICVNGRPPKNVKIGTVGPKIGPEIELKIAQDGEILFKGPNLMLGYYKAPDKTKEVIDEDGWFHTGDVGEIDEDGFLKITDRKKEIFKLSTGKYIAPQMIENTLKESPYIEQAMVVGEGEKFAGALISPNFEAVINWAKKNNISFKDKKELIQNKNVIKLFKSEINEFNKRFASYERINTFKIVPDEWTPATGELSQTLKLKRRVIKAKYQDYIKQMYRK